LFGLDHLSHVRSQPSRARGKSKPLRGATSWAAPSGLARPPAPTARVKKGISGSRKGSDQPQQRLALWRFWVGLLYENFDIELRHCPA
jgi:hypothetical protein